MTKEELRNDWEKRIKDYQESGLSMSKWCKKTGNKLHQLQYWLKKYKNNTIPKKENTNWVSVNLNTKDNSSMENNTIKLKIGKCEIEIKSGFDVESLKKVVSVVNELC